MWWIYRSPAWSPATAADPPGSTDSTRTSCRLVEWYSRTPKPLSAGEKQVSLLRCLVRKRRLKRGTLMSILDHKDGDGEVSARELQFGLRTLGARVSAP